MSGGRLLGEKFLIMQNVNSFQNIVQCTLDISRYLFPKDLGKGASWDCVLWVHIWTNIQFYSLLIIFNIVLYSAATYRYSIEFGCKSSRCNMVSCLFFLLFFLLFRTTHSYVSRNKTSNMSLTHWGLITQITVNSVSMGYRFRQINIVFVQRTAL